MSLSPEQLALREQAQRWRCVRSAALVSALLCGTAACRSYHERTAHALAAFERGDFERSIEDYADADTTGSPFLAGAEAGMVALAAGNWEAAQLQLGRAAEVVREREDSPPITPETTAETAAALLLNEGAAEYLGEGYERVMLHAALGITYLARGDIDGLGVEARRANKLLEHEEELYEKQYAAGGLGHFMSALSYELQGDLDDAYIDYGRMRDKEVGTELAGRALVRLAKRLGYAQELGELETTFGAAAELPGDAANIVVIAGVGMGPFKVEQTLALPLKHGVGQVSVPAFAERAQPVSAVELRVGGASAPLRTSRIEDVARVAKENLDDRIGWLAARSVLRGVLKYEATRRLGEELGKQHGDGGEIAGYILGSLFTMATERADLRAWNTLPDSWQAARMWLAPGSHTIELAAVGGEALTLGTFDLARGETMFVIARTLGTRLYAYPIGGRRLDAPAAAGTTTPSASNTP